MNFSAVILLLCVLVVSVTAELEIVHTPYLLSDMTKIKDSSNYTSLGGQFGWRLSWNIASDTKLQSSASIGPFEVLTKNGTVLGEFMMPYGGMGVWSESGDAYSTIDPCVHPLPEGDQIYTVLDLSSTNVTGQVNLTAAYTSLYEIGNIPNTNNSLVPLSCFGVECKTFYFFNGTTDLNGYIIELNITSPIAAQLSYAYGSGNCPSVRSSTTHNVTVPINTTVTIRIENERQIWFMFDNFKDNGESTSAYAEVSWRYLPAGSNKDDNKLMWGLIIGGIAAAVIIVIVVVVVVVRKKRSSYTQKHCSAVDSDSETDRWYDPL